MRPLVAALAAGYSRKTALHKSYRMDKAVGMVGMHEALEAAGLTDKVLAHHAAEGIKAMRVQACDIYVTQEATGKLKFNDSQDFIEVPDWNARHRYFHSICELTNRITHQPLIDLSEHTHLTLVVDKEKVEGEKVLPDSETRVSLETPH